MDAGATTEFKDGLEVRETDNGRWQVFDTLTDKFVASSSLPTRQLAEGGLAHCRKNRRALIVRWVYGLPLAESRKLGVPED